MRRSGKFLLLSLFALCSLRPPCFSQDAPQQDEQTLQELSQNIRGRLLDLRKQSEDMTRQLETLSQNLAKSRSEASQWEQAYRNLQNSLNNMTRQYNECYDDLLRYQERLRTRARIIAVLGVIILIRIVGMAAALVLYARGFPTPRWIDILL